MAVLRGWAAAADLDRADVLPRRAQFAAVHRRARRDRVRLVMEQRPYQRSRSGHLQSEGRQAEERPQEVTGFTWISRDEYIIV